METRTANHEGWLMEATVEQRTNGMGEQKFYIFTVAFKQFPMSVAILPSMENHNGGPFDSADEAFDAAFRDCRRDIDRLIANS